LKMGLLPFEKFEREILVKQDAETSNSYGCYPLERPIGILLNFGIINLDKPAGPTSHQIADYVKKILYIKKTGHSGSLDPNVTGVLPIAIGRATRVVQTLLKAGKEYVCIMHLHSDIEEEKIRSKVSEFTGKISQLPPVKSAVRRKIREREIYYFEILEIKGRDVLFKVGCEAGTYIRKLVHDFGLSLGTRAHMAELVRTKVGPFSDSDWVTLHDLKDAYEFWKEDKEEVMLRKVIRPVEDAVAHLPCVWVLDTTVDSIAHGADLHVPGIAKLHSGIEVGDVVAVMTLKNELVCLGKAAMNSQNMLLQDNGLAVSSHKVFMERGVYPRFKKQS